MKRSLQVASLLCLFPLAQLAQAANSDGYVYDTRSVIVRDNYGNCVRTGSWAASNAIKECDPSLFKAVEPVKPTPVVAAPEAVAAVAAAPKAAHIPVVVSLGADESFASGKADLKPAAKLKLVQFVKDLRNVNYRQISIVGHADRTGNKTANQTLSERRANTVHNFLVSEGLSSDKLDSNGVGSSQPKTSAKDCAKLQSKKLQACLAPDRRVEISVLDIRTKE